MNNNKFWKDGPQNYSALFFEHCIQFKYKFSHDLRHPHPFYYVELSLELKTENNTQKDKQIWAFSETYAVLTKIVEKEQEAMRWLQLEYSAVYLRKKNKYLNKAIDALRQLHISADKKLNEESGGYEEKKHHSFQNHHNPIPFIIEMSIRRNLFNIFSLYQRELNQVNWNYLSKLFLPREPIFSFKRVKPIKDEDLEYHFKSGLIDTGILDPQTDFRIFKNLFMRQPLKKRIEWRETIEGLAYFIKMLIKKEIIEKPGNKHWDITTEFFSIKGAPAPNLKKQHIPRQDLKDKIDAFIENIYSNFQK